MFQVAESVARVIQTVKSNIHNPLAMYEQTEGDSRDVTFVQSLPNEPLRLFYRHAQDVLRGYYTAELKGALSSKASQTWTWQKFHEIERVKKHFLEGFVSAYGSFSSKKDEKADSAADEEVVQVKAQEEPPEPEKVKKGR